MPPTAALAQPPPQLAEVRRPSAPSPRGFFGPVTLGAATLAAGAIGLGLYGSADASYHSLLDSCAPRCSPPQIAGLEIREQAGIAFLVVGAAALVADSAWWMVAARSRRHLQAGAH
jgi:hypothetical protein